MRLLVMSDLHFEFHRDGGEAFCSSYRDFEGYDVSVIAGDLCDYKSIAASVSWLARTFEHTVNDFEQIRGLGGEVDRLHRESKDWLWDTLSSDDVLVTHHLPSERSIHSKYQGSNLNRFFVGDIEELIRRRRPRLVIHGHTHESCDYFIGETRVVCNPFGYARHALNRDFREKLVIEI